MINIEDVNYDEMGRPLCMTFEVVKHEPIYDTKAHEIKEYFVYCDNSMECYLIFPMEGSIPEIGTEFNITFDWSDK